MNGNHQKSIGHPTVLTKEEEKALTSYINFMHARAFPLSVPLKAFAWRIAKRSGRDALFNLNDGPGATWWHGYFKRNGETFSLKRPDILDRSRAKMANPNVIFDYFAKLKEIMHTLEVTDKPYLIFNADESGLNLELRKGKVVVPKGKPAHSQSKGSRDHMTVHCCISASGQSLPLMIIYQGSFPFKNYVKSGAQRRIVCKVAKRLHRHRTFQRVVEEPF